MNEQLQKALAELLIKTNNGIDTAGEFLASELPEVIQQLLMWHGIKSAVYFVFGILLIVFLPKICNKIISLIPIRPTEDNTAPNWFYERYYCNSSTTDIGGVFFCIFSVLSIIILSLIAINIINIEWLQIWIAPKVWLIEYAASIAK